MKGEGKTVFKNILTLETYRTIFTREKEGSGGKKKKKNFTSVSWEGVGGGKSSAAPFSGWKRQKTGGSAIAEGGGGKTNDKKTKGKGPMSSCDPIWGGEGKSTCAKAEKAELPFPRGGKRKGEPNDHQKEGGRGSLRPGKGGEDLGGPQGNAETGITISSREQSRRKGGAGISEKRGVSH